MIGACRGAQRVGECLDAARWELALEGSFDSVAGSLREPATALRMTIQSRAAAAKMIGACRGAQRVGECLDAARWGLALSGSFDSAAGSLRVPATALRMTSS